MNNVAHWNGATWSALSTGLGSYVYGLSAYDTTIVACGSFTLSGSYERSLNRIARWNGTQWDSLGSGLNSAGLAVFAVGDTLFVGGTFTIAGGKSSKYLARWVNPPPSSVATPENAAGSALVMLLGNSPNPFAAGTTIKFSVAHGIPVRLSVHDISGRLVSTLVDETMREGPHEAFWNGLESDGRPAASGVYVVRVLAGDHVSSRKMILTR